MSAQTLDERARALIAAREIAGDAPIGLEDAQRICRAVDATPPIGETQRRRVLRLLRTSAALTERDPIRDSA